MRMCLVVLIIAFLSSCSQKDSISNEGSVSSPVNLTLYEYHSAEIGANGKSYYKFTASTQGEYAVSIEEISSDMKMQLYSDVGFTNLIVEADQYIGIDEPETLSQILESGTYYVIVEEKEGVKQKFTMYLDKYL
jgi:hypothetical protein